jgi:hypothetical protein
VQGAQGAQGFQGAQGTSGVQGFEGAQGTSGVQGFQGAQGTSGVQGFQGAQGLQGAQGTSGVQGFQGEQGLQGAQGTSGVQGFQGAQGTLGVQGAQGVQGFQGLQGVEGTGVQGFQGVQGPEGPAASQGSNTFYVSGNNISITSTVTTLDDVSLGSGTVFKLVGNSTVSTEITGFVRPAYGRFITIFNDTDPASTVAFSYYGSSTSQPTQQIFLPCSQTKFELTSIGDSAQFLYTSVSNLSSTYWCLLQANSCPVPAPP